MRVSGSRINDPLSRLADAHFIIVFVSHPQVVGISASSGRRHSYLFYVIFKDTVFDKTQKCISSYTLKIRNLYASKKIVTSPISSLVRPTCFYPFRIINHFLNTAPLLTRPCRHTKIRFRKFRRVYHESGWWITNPVSDPTGDQ